jgi:hypothetical protein
VLGHDVSIHNGLGVLLVGVVCRRAAPGNAKAGVAAAAGATLDTGPRRGVGRLDGVGVGVFDRGMHRAQ